MSELTFQDPKKKFCEQLRATRESKNLDISRMAERTKIAQHYLEKLESGEWDFLPHAYVRAFLRTYAQVVGMDVGATLAQFDDIVDEPPVPVPGYPVEEEELAQRPRKPKQKKKRGEEEEKAPGPKFTMAAEESAPRSTNGDGENSSNFLFWGMGGAVVIAIVLLLAFWPRGEEPQQAEEIPFEEVVQEHEQMVDGGQDEEKQPARSAAGAGQQPATPAPADTPDLFDPTQRIVLLAEATDRCYIRVTADRDTVPMEDVVLDPGMTRKYEADSLLVVVLGNAGGMKLSLGSEDLGVLGETGRVVTAVIGPEGLRRIRRGVLRRPDTQTGTEQEQPSAEIDLEDLTRPRGAPRSTATRETTRSDSLTGSPSPSGVQ